MNRFICRKKVLLYLNNNVVYFEIIIYKFVNDWVNEGIGYG